MKKIKLLTNSSIIKKIKLFGLIMLLGAISLIATSARNSPCEKNADCPSDMLCAQLEVGAGRVCVAVEMSGSGIKCFSCIHMSGNSAVVECSTCSLMIGWTDDMFCFSSRCAK
ncbi:MAG: hypothetical protein RR555_10715 [Bacteroidales bacterium]